MKQALINMLTMQDKMNSRVHPDWVQQHFEWYRATWIECGELIEHYGYKWWKKQEPDLEQVCLEIIDIWHFGMSALFLDGKNIEQIATELEAELGNLWVLVCERPPKRWQCAQFFPAGQRLQGWKLCQDMGGQGRDEHLVELVAPLDKSAIDFADQVYRALEGRYQELVAQA